MNTELRQAISGEEINQLQLGSLDVGFYLATSAEPQAYGAQKFRKENEQFSDVDISKLAIKLIVRSLT